MASLCLHILILDNRELAGLILLGIGLLIALIKQEVRQSLAGVMNAFFRLLILGPIVAMLFWIGFELWVGRLLGIWDPTLSKGTIMWTIGSAGVLLFNCAKTDSNLYFFRRTIISTTGVGVFVIFFVNLYPFNLFVEFVMQITAVLSILMVAVAGQKLKYRLVKGFFELLLISIAFAMLIHALRQVYMDWYQIDLWRFSLEYFLPIWLTVGLLPFLYAFSIFLAYDFVFRFIDDNTEGQWSVWRSRIALMSMLHFRAGTVRKFVGYWPVQLGKTRTFSAAIRVIADFLSYQKRDRQTQKDEKKRLRRYVGSQGDDGEGRRLDRREFMATQNALNRLETCQMGWYRNCNCYRADLLNILADDFTRLGLPQESGITLHVAEDGQSWYAWRRTVTGWCFAIGGDGPPPNRWEHDGLDPPTGFPGVDVVWGDSPFSNQSNRNWR